MDNQILSPTKAARTLEVSRETIYRWMNQGVLPFQRFPSGRRFITRETIQSIIDGKKQESKNNANL